MIDAIDIIGNELRKAVRPVARKGATAPLGWKEILDSLLKDVEPVNFRERAKLPEDGKISLKAYAVLTIDVIREMAEARDWGLCTREGFIYVFNGAYWACVTDGDFKAFLAKAAVRMGVPDLDARYHQFKDELFKQFISESFQRMPEREKGVLINLRNGTFEIEGERQVLREFRREDFILHQLPFEYDPAAKCPMFQRFLDDVLPDKDCQKVLAEYMGYVFTVGMNLQKVLMLYGPGSNGKGVVFQVLYEMLGRDANVSNYSLQSLTRPESYERADLGNRLLNFGTEINGRVESSIFKQLASCEPVQVRQIYGRPYIMTRYGKLLFSCNQLPTDVEQTHAYFRRFIIIPFNKIIKDEDVDPELGGRIVANELPGVFNWVLDGLRRLIRNKKFTPSEVVKEQVERYKKESDSVAMFIDEFGYAPGVSEYVTLKGLYSEYKTFAVDDGYRQLSMRKFSDSLRASGFEIVKTRDGRVVYLKREDML